jgi:DNA (cytosine-5)-methyltransferase 1
MSATFKPVAIDLFCGAGGLSEGLEQAGFEVKLGLDFDRHAIATYAHNHPSASTMHCDIQNVTGLQILQSAGCDEVDLIAGGPSCQGFSTHGKRIQDDPRNFLFKHFVRIVSEVRPKMFLMENVRGMLTYSKGEFKRQIEQAFSEIGYHTAFSAVCAADFGVPQMRRRVLFIGTRYEDLELSFPQPTHGEDAGLLPYVTIGDALGDLPMMKEDFHNGERRYAKAAQNEYQRYSRAGAGRSVSLHMARPLSPQAASLAKYIGVGQGLRAVPPAKLPARFQKMRTIGNGDLRKDCTTLYHRPHPAKPSYTITTHYRNVASGPFLNPWEDRSLSHREAARLMSFPDRFHFKGECLQRQIGNAVPPLLAKAIGLHLRMLLAEMPPIQLARAA